MSKNFHKNKYNSPLVRHNVQNTLGGVTLIELVVVIFIFMVISSITIFNYGKFRSSLSIQNLADDIALSVRRAQGFAIGVRGSSGGFDKGYGVHFTANPSSSLYAGSWKSFILFMDMNAVQNRKYDYDNSNTCGTPTASNECLELLSITTADSINSIFLNNDTTPISLADTVDLLFKRPSPEPTFCYRSGGTGSCSLTSISRIRIRLSSNASVPVYKTITISNNGQIIVSDI